ncbi:MAG: hypothetical protein ACYS47_09070, partial [Planctomycetota bacterium]
MSGAQALRRFLLGVLPLALAVAACSRKDEDPTPPPAPQPVTVIDETVDGAGGLFQAPAGGDHEGLRIFVPPGTLGGPASLTVTWTPTPGSVEGGYRFITAAWAVHFDDHPLAKPFRLRMPCLAGETTAEGAAVLRWEAALDDWEPGLLARLDAAPDGVVLAADAAGTFAAVARSGGPEAGATSEAFDVAADTANITASAGAGCRFGATLLSRYDAVYGAGGLFSRWDAAKSLLVAHQVEARHRIERLGMPGAVGNEGQTSAAENAMAIRLALGATRRPVWLLLTDRIPLLAYGFSGNAIDCYNPAVGNVATTLTFTGSDFLYFAVNHANVRPLGTDPAFDGEITATLGVVGVTDVPALVQNVPTGGATLNVTTGPLAGTIVEIGPGDLVSPADVEVEEPAWQPLPPRGAELCSEFVQVTGPPDNLFAGQIAVTLPYVDPLSADESKLQLGCHVPGTDGWALTRVTNRDTTGNTIRGLCRRAGVYAVFGYAPRPSGTTTDASSAFI